MEGVSAERQKRGFEAIKIYFQDGIGKEIRSVDINGKRKSL
jgi:hypothetical protein